VRPGEANDRHNGAVIAWCLRDGTGQVVESVNADITAPTASVGKVLLLLAVADAFENGQLDPDAPLPRPEPVADSGLWQHLSVPDLAANDAAVLVGSVSDNLASNALLNVVGLKRVRAITDDLGFPELQLHDRVRDHRTMDHPTHLSHGNAAQWSALMHGLFAKTLISSAVSCRVLSWLSLCVDHSLVLAPFAFDPLVADRRGWTCANKTGADPGTRADVGVIGDGTQTYTYAALADGEDEFEAVARMRQWGVSVRERFVG
jgi:beta-lactamase class A